MRTSSMHKHVTKPPFQESARDCLNWQWQPKQTRTHGQTKSTHSASRLCNMSVSSAKRFHWALTEKPQHKKEANNSDKQMMIPTTNKRDKWPSASELDIPSCTKQTRTCQPNQQKQQRQIQSAVAGQSSRSAVFLCKLTITLSHVWSGNVKPRSAEWSAGIQNQWRHLPFQPSSNVRTLRLSSNIGTFWWMSSKGRMLNPTISKCQNVKDHDFLIIGIGTSRLNQLIVMTSCHVALDCSPQHSLCCHRLNLFI